MIHRDRNTAPHDTELVAWPQGHRQWARTARGTMIVLGAEESAVGALLAEARQSVESSGQSPGELFGTPEPYGRTRAKGLRTPVALSESNTPFSSISAALQLLLVSGGTVLGRVKGLARTQPWVEGTECQRPCPAAFPVLSVVVGLCCRGWVVRARGRLRAARAVWSGALVICVGASLAVANLEEFALPGPPNWIMPCLGAALCAIGLMLPQSKERALVDDTDWPDAQWFGHAENLLRGR